MDIIYLDETGFVSSAHRLYGWSKIGERVYGQQDARSGVRTSLIGAYHKKKLIAPLLFEGCCNAALFELWLEEYLLPIIPKGSVLVLDNAAFHRKQSSVVLVEKAGCSLLFLPPYSPHLNPIEKLWANLKRFRRNHEYSSSKE